MVTNNQTKRFSNQMLKIEKHVILDLWESLCLRADMISWSFSVKLIVNLIAVLVSWKTNFTTYLFSITSRIELTSFVLSINKRTAQIYPVHHLFSSGSLTRSIQSAKLSPNLMSTIPNQDTSKTLSSSEASLMLFVSSKRLTITR